MNQHEILTKLNDLKGNLQQLITKRLGSKNEDVETMEAEATVDKVDNFVDDLPLTLARDAGPGGVTYYETENSPLARGARKEPARGIDKFN